MCFKHVSLWCWFFKPFIIHDDSRAASYQEIVLDCHLTPSYGLSTWHDDSYIFQEEISTSIAKGDLWKQCE